MTHHAEHSDQELIHIRQVNHVLDYIHTHIWQEMSLDCLAAIAGFSKYHFHRIFRDMMNETLDRYIWQTRVEYAANLLRGKPLLTISDAAQRSGFQSLPGFSRAFKRCYGYSPSDWNRKRSLLEQPDMNMTHNGERLLDTVHHYSLHVRIKQFPSMKIAYTRVPGYGTVDCLFDAYTHLKDHFQRLPNLPLLGLLIRNQGIRATHRCYFDWGVQVTEHYPTVGLIQERQLPAFTAATIHIKSENHQLETGAWNYLKMVWLPESSYYPTSLPSFKIYRHLPEENGVCSRDLELVLPIERL